MLCSALCVIAQGVNAADAVESAATSHSAPTVAAQVAQMEAMCAARAKAPSAALPKTLFTRLGGEARIHVITREMVRLHQANPTLSSIVHKYNVDYLADILARYLITATGGPKRYDGPPLNQTHAHLHLSNAHFLAGGEDFSEAMTNVGASQDDILDTMCLLGGLKSQIVQE